MDPLLGTIDSVRNVKGAIEHYGFQVDAYISLPFLPNLVVIFSSSPIPGPISQWPALWGGKHKSNKPKWAFDCFSSALWPPNMNIQYQHFNDQLYILEVKTALKRWKEEALASGSNPDALLFYFCGHGGDLSTILKYQSMFIGHLYSQLQTFTFHFPWQIFPWQATLFDLLWSQKCFLIIHHLYHQNQKRRFHFQDTLLLNAMQSMKNMKIPLSSPGQWETSVLVEMFSSTTTGGRCSRMKSCRPSVRFVFNSTETRFNPPWKQEYIGMLHLESRQPQISNQITRRERQWRPMWSSSLTAAAAEKA